MFFQETYNNSNSSISLLYIHVHICNYILKKIGLMGQRGMTLMTKKLQTDMNFKRSFILSKDATNRKECLRIMMSRDRKIK